MHASDALPWDIDLDDHPHDQCGVFGVWEPGEDVSRLTYFALYALQHRGQQAAGIAASDGQGILVYKDLGLVSQVFSEQNLTGLRGHIAIGHCRYATTGANTWPNAQPTLGPTPWGTLALAHNGNLINTAALRRLAHALAPGQDVTHGATTDTAVITALLGMAGRMPAPARAVTPVRVGAAPARQAHGDAAAGVDVRGSGSAAPPSSIAAPPRNLVDNALRLLPELLGAFTLVFMDETTLYGARDPHGYRPLMLGRLNEGWVLASETSALDLVGARFEREVEPGELVTIDRHGVRSFRFARPAPRSCVFEYVYLSRPDSMFGGRQIVAARRAMGATLAREHPARADLVIPTPESGTPAAIGYSHASGIPFAQGLVKNAYVGRTFIEPTQGLRQQGIRLKLNPMREVIAGKRLIVVDDSIVRGNTQRALVRMLREAGAREVHVRISSPPVVWPCFFGIDFPTRQELIASARTVEQVRAHIDADSLGYLSLPGMVTATGLSEDQLCVGCFTGRYPDEVAPGTPIPGTPGATA